MQPAVRDELERASMAARMLERLPPSPLGDEGERLRAELSAQVVPDSRAQKIRRFFGEKLAFLSVDRNRMATPVARVLRHIHQYRNESQHQDRVRVGSIQPATLILFDIATELFVTLRSGKTSRSSGPRKASERRSTSGRRCTITSTFATKSWTRCCCVWGSVTAP